MAKTKTYDQLLATQAKAVRFVRDALGDDDRANEIEDESPEEYAERKGIEIVENPFGGAIGPIGNRFFAASPHREYEGRTRTMTKPELEERVAELEEENQTLNDKLDSILDIAAAEDEEVEDWR